VNDNAVAGRDYAARGLARYRITPKRIIVHALLNLEGSCRFRRIGGLVNIGRHRAIYS
jgi:hypothetical protein